MPLLLTHSLTHFLRLPKKRESIDSGISLRAQEYLPIMNVPHFTHTHTLYIVISFLCWRTYNNAILSEIIQTLQHIANAVSKSKNLYRKRHILPSPIHSFSKKKSCIHKRWGHNRNKSGQEEIMSIYFLVSLFQHLTHTHTGFSWCFSYLDFILLISVPSSLSSSDRKNNVFIFLLLIRCCYLSCFSNSEYILRDLAIMSYIFYNPLWLFQSFTS